MAKNMPTADEALKKFFSDNAVFADLFNSFLFKCEFIKEDELVSVETAYADSVSVNQSKKELAKSLNIGILLEKQVPLGIL